ncbi:MAG: hypothetical protein AB7Q37_04670 [Pyrinomonadaceae bacterium]
MKYAFSRFYLAAFLITAAFGCSSGDDRPATPIETFKTYSKAIKNKDTTTMKLLLSSSTIKMHELEAQAQGVTVDDIVKRETLVSEATTTVKLRNEKIDGDNATLEVENSTGQWETVPFVLEDGVWKIDKKGFAQRLMEDAERNMRGLDNLTNQNTQQP